LANISKKTPLLFIDSPGWGISGTTLPSRRGCPLSFATNHAIIGANELEGLLSARIVWLIRHHLDLLVAPRNTRRRLRHSHQLRELELLRVWDLKGRSPTATVMAPKEAINILIQHGSSLLARNETAHVNNAFG